jgi:HK97 family phage prohead protease
MTKREVRAIGKLEVRAAVDGSPRKIGGYASMFNSPTEIGGYFMEQVAPGAFTAAIGRDDVRALFNHDPNYVIGRTINKTLELSEDDKGLIWEASPPDTQWARDLVASIDRGDVSQCSFGFVVTKETWDETGDVPMRTIQEVELYDVSPVTYPAYEDTSVSVRKLEEYRAANKPAEIHIGAAVRTRMKIELFDHLT